MRLRNLMASTLPRSRKQKKRLALSISSTAHTHNQLSPCSDKSGVWPRSADAEPKLDLSWNKFLVTEDFQYLEKPKSMLEQDDFIKVNLNTDSDKSCACHKEIDSGDVTGLTDNTWQDSTLEFQQDFDNLANGNYNTVPRSRTRIKTNPWLPSPKSSPSGSCNTSPMTSLTTSPTHSDVDQKLVFDDSGDFAFFPTGLTGESPLGKGHKRGRHDSVESVPSSDSASILQRSFTSEMSDSSVTANERDFAVSPDSGVGHLPLREDCDTHRYFSESSYRTPIRTNPESMLRYGAQPQALQLESPVSFEYEEVFESQLETPNVGEVIGSRESVWDKYGTYECLTDPRLLTGCHSAVGGSQDTLTCHSYKSGVSSSSEEDSYDVEYAQNDDVSSDSEQEDYSGMLECNNNNNSCSSSCMHGCLEDHETLMEEVLESLDSAYDTGSFTGTFPTVTADDDDVFCRPPTNQIAESTVVPDVAKCMSADVAKRRVTRIRSSLEDKVLKLRREKKVVDEKIRQAQEEERIRLEEKMKMQKQITLLRKQILTRTLQELRTKLEGQSQRLQTAYDDVIDRQWAEARSKHTVLTSGAVLHYDKETAL